MPLYYGRGQFPGTNTNDNAIAGAVGEFVFSGPTTNLANATITVTIAAPGVVTDTAHGMLGNVAVQFTTNGALPTGITASTTYYTIGSSITANTYRLATSLANAIAGTAITTTGSQSGTHTRSIRLNLASTTTLDFGAISLTAGDWDVYAGIEFIAAATTAIATYGGSISTAAATFNYTPQSFFQMMYVSTGTVIGNANFLAATMGPLRLSLAATTAIYGNTNTSFTISTLAGWGTLFARRIR